MFGFERKGNEKRGKKKNNKRKINWERRHLMGVWSCVGAKEERRELKLLYSRVTKLKNQYIGKRILREKCSKTKTRINNAEKELKGKFKNNAK